LPTGNRIHRRARALPLRRRRPRLVLGAAGTAFTSGAPRVGVRLGVGTGILEPSVWLGASIVCGRLIATGIAPVDPVNPGRRAAGLARAFVRAAIDALRKVDERSSGSVRPKPTSVKESPSAIWSSDSSKGSIVAGVTVSPE
jgi:hypothetical protein